MAAGEVQHPASMLGYSAQHGERFLKVLPVHGVDGGVVASAPVGVLMEPPLLSAHSHRWPPARSRQYGLAITRTECTAVRSSLRDYLLHIGFPHAVYPKLFATVPQINNSIADFLVHGVMLTRSERAGSAVTAQASRQLKTRSFWNPKARTP